MQTVYVVITEINGYRNIFGHDVFTDRGDAEFEQQRAIDSKCWDNVYILTFNLR